MSTDTSTALAELSAAGVSIWLDDISRERLTSGNLADLVESKHVVGVTSNPTIFQKALEKGTAYDDQVRDGPSGTTERSLAVSNWTPEAVTGRNIGPGRAGPWTDPALLERKVTLRQRVTWFSSCRPGEAYGQPPTAGGLMTCSLMAPVAGGGFWRAGDYRMLDAADPDRCFSDLMQHPV
jgi:hypothetical protein